MGKKNPIPYRVKVFLPQIKWFSAEYEGIVEANADSEIRGRDGENENSGNAGIRLGPAKAGLRRTDRGDRAGGDGEW
jgi:hypothetical protein